MATSTFLFLFLRALHVLLAALWVGATAFILVLLMPTVAETGAAGGQVMVGINRRGLAPLMASVSGLTVLTGLYLMWRFTAGFDSTISATNAGRAFGIGGAAGILATILGASVVGRGVKKMAAVMSEALKLPDGPERASLMQTAASLRGRLKSTIALVLLLQVIALVLMAVGHYI